MKVLPLLALLLVLGWGGTFGLGQRSLNADEAIQIARVGLPPSAPADLIEIARSLRDDLRDLLATLRAEGLPAAPLYTLLLNLWTFKFGEDAGLLRLPSLWIGLLVLALLLRMARHLWPASPRAPVYAATLLLLNPAFWGMARAAQPPLFALAAALLAGLALLQLRARFTRAWAAALAFALALGLLCFDFSGWTLLVLLAAGLALALTHLLLRLPQRRAGPLFALFVLLLFSSADLLPPVPDVGGALAQLASQRRPDEPLILSIPPQHPAAYHLRQQALRQGYTLDLGWQPFAPVEAERIVRRLGDVPRLWFAIHAQDAGALAAYAALEAERVLAFSADAGEMRIRRLDLPQATQQETEE